MWTIGIKTTMASSGLKIPTWAAAHGAGAFHWLFLLPSLSMSISRIPPFLAYSLTPSSASTPLASTKISMEAIV